MRRLLAGIAVGLSVAACREPETPAGPSGAQLDVAAAPAQTAPEKYIVIYKSTVGDPRAEISRNVSVMGARVERVFQSAVKGWSGELSPAELARLRSDSRVALVEKDGPVHIQTTQAPTPSWGLDRIDQLSLPLNSSYTYNRTGAGVHFYGLDTGILYTHTDFGGRASAGFDAVTTGGNSVDCHGHGTHTASTAAGTTYGVAKAMIIVGVRVLDCGGSGSISGVIAGVDWVTQNAIRPAVANMSLGGGPSAALDSAIARSVASGVVYAVASGNSSVDACTTAPANLPVAITVNASGSNDAAASFSNFGTCTDIFAPGVGITAATIGSTTATATMSGTSMATPHVAGAAGLYLQANPTATVAQVTQALTSNAGLNKISNPGAGSPNRLLNISFIGSGSPANQPPTASITSPTAGASFVTGAPITFSGTGLDPEDGTLSGGSLVWTSSLNGQIGTGTTFTRSNLSVGTHLIKLTVRDSKLAKTEAKMNIIVTATASNQLPSATMTSPAANGSFAQGASVGFSGSGMDPEDGVLTGASLVWTSSRDGQLGTGVGFTSTTLSVGTHVITLTATDSKLATGSVSRTITITPVNQFPSATITSPGVNAVFTQGTVVTFAGTGIDFEDGTLSGGSLIWTSSLNGQIGTGTTFTRSNLSVGTHLIKLTVRDSKLAKTEAKLSITITP